MSPMQVLLGLLGFILIMGIIGFITSLSSAMRGREERKRDKEREQTQAELAYLRGRLDERNKKGD